MPNIGYLKNLIARLKFPDDAAAYLLDCAETLNRSDALLLFNDTLRAYEASNYDYAGMDGRFAGIGERAGFHEYTAAMLCLLAECEVLEKKYTERGLGEQLFLDTMSDLRFKLIESINVKHVVGTFVASWYRGFFTMDRFALGRFQFEKVGFNAPVYGIAGHYVRHGDTVLNFHIPSSGVSLTDEVRYDSYRRAREFFFPDATGPVPFVCSSWLLWPGYEEAIPDTLNLKKFRRDFTIVGMSEPKAEFGNGWRVFADKADLPADELPTDTAQRRMFAQYCREGKPHGNGYGVFFFDGEKIVR